MIFTFCIQKYLLREKLKKWGRVVLSVRPWADIFLNGKKLGTTPLAPLILWEGAYELRLVNPQLKADKKIRVNVKANDTVKVVHNLQ